MADSPCSSLVAVVSGKGQERILSRSSDPEPPPTGPQSTELLSGATTERPGRMVTGHPAWARCWRGAVLQPQPHPQAPALPVHSPVCICGATCQDLRAGNQHSSDPRPGLSYRLSPAWEWPVRASRDRVSRDPWSKRQGHWRCFPCKSPTRHLVGSRAACLSPGSAWPARPLGNPCAQQVLPPAPSQLCHWLLGDRAQGLAGVAAK